MSPRRPGALLAAGAPSHGRRRPLVLPGGQGRLRSPDPSSSRPPRAASAGPLRVQPRRPPPGAGRPSAPGRPKRCQPSVSGNGCQSLDDHSASADTLGKEFVSTRGCAVWLRSRRVTISKASGSRQSVEPPQLRASQSASTVDRTVSTTEPVKQSSPSRPPTHPCQIKPVKSSRTTGWFSTERSRVKRSLPV
jgi:hypothetical protein